MHTNTTQHNTPNPPSLLDVIGLLAILLLAPSPSPAQALPPAPSQLVQMLDVPAGTFTMGRRSDGDDAIYGSPNELPRHPVTLSAYQIGKYPVTNGQLCDILNWALAKGYLQNSDGTPYTHGDVWKNGQKLLVIAPDTGPNAYYIRSEIDFSGGAFTWKSRPDRFGRLCSMEKHPAVGISWYGAVAFCNWLSEREGLIPCFDLNNFDTIDADNMTTGTQFQNGYRLPTKAEWVRAASVDGDKQWIYGCMSDTLTFDTGSARANYRLIQGVLPDGSAYAIGVNPLGLDEEPFTSPVGWFNGINVSPNGNVQTVDSHSPIGAYDMAGNVREWCYDYSGDKNTPMSSAPETDPTGPTTGTTRLMHGGSFNTLGQYVRAYCTDGDPPGDTYFHDGFRLARNAPKTAAKAWQSYR